MIQSHTSTSEDLTSSKSENMVNRDQIIQSENKGISDAVPRKEFGNQGSDGPSGRAYDSLASLPLEFYHYYHGSNTDMGTLIEVILAILCLLLHVLLDTILLAAKVKPVGFLFALAPI